MEEHRTIVLLPPMGSSNYDQISEVISEGLKGPGETLLIPLGFHSNEELSRFKATVRYPEDFFDRGRGEQIDSQALRLAQSWYLPLGDEIVFDGVNLAQMCEYSFYYVFVDCLRSIDIANRLIESEKMDRLVLPQISLTKEISEICYESLPNAFELMARGSGITVERIKSPTPSDPDEAEYTQSSRFWNKPYIYERFLETEGSIVSKRAVFFYNVYARELIANELRKHGLRPLRSIPYQKSSARTKTFSRSLRAGSKESFEKIIGDQHESGDASDAAKTLARDRFSEFLLRIAPILSEYVEWARFYSKKMRPRVFVCMEDATPVNRCVSRVLREGGAQVVILQHGLLAQDMAGFYLMPIEGSIQGVWGRYYLEWHSERGKDPSILVVTGNPNFENIRPQERELVSVREKLGLEINRPMILIGTSRYSGSRSISTVEKELRFFDGVYSGLSGEMGYQIVTKMHPSCGKSYYEMAMQAATKNQVKTILTKDHLRELLALAQVLVMPISSIGYEAVLLRKPLVCIDFEGFGEENYFASAKVGIGVEKASELARGIRRAIELTTTKEYEASRQLFLDYHLNGNSPSRRVAELINEQFHLSGEQQRNG